MQIAKDAKFKRFVIRKTFSEKARSMAGPKGWSIQSHRGLFEEVRLLTHGYPQLSKHKPGIGMRLFRKDLDRNLLANGVNL